MNKGMYRKLAFNNIRNNKNTFLPFSLSCIAMVAMFYMVYSIHMQVDENLFMGARSARKILGLGTIICGIFSLFVIFYTNGFLMKRRSKEFGLYSILGMEKKHISRVVFWEIAMVGAGSIIIGILSGMLFSRLMFMVLLEIIHLQTEFVFGISAEALAYTFVLFTGDFMLMILINTIRVYLLKPIDLMSGSRAGEKEPKAKWVMAAAGILCLGVGYYLAVSTEDPFSAFGIFFIAALFVIAGTYLVFMSGSIALLKLLKNNKNYYYQKNHFITVSGMMYRMKQNAAGLAVVCILSTAVLVTLSSTISLYMGLDNVLRNLYPKDVRTDYLYMEGEDAADSSGHYDYSVLEPALRARAEEYHVIIKDIEQYYHYSHIGILDGNCYRVLTEEDSFDEVKWVSLEIVTLEDYNNLMGTDYKAEPGNVWIYTTDDVELPGDTVKIFEREYPVCGRLEDVSGFRVLEYDSLGKLCVIVPDLKTMEEMKGMVDTVWCISADENDEVDPTILYYNFDFDLEGGFEDKKAFCTDLREAINETGIAHTASVENIYTARQEYVGIYGSLFFIGIFIGTLFLITTVMIIYYKQISEGYDDRERFIIMRKVGMSSKEIKGAIKSQILLVFFLPILLAVIHICFAFNIIEKILLLLDLTNVTLFIICTIATVAVFCIVYGIVYSLTARAYYHIIYR